jgi:hypothetical protein
VLIILSLLVVAVEHHLSQELKTEAAEVLEVSAQAQVYLLLVEQNIRLL